MRYRINLDFDAALALNNSSYQNTKFVNELEYIFFLVNQSDTNTLCSVKQYDSEYLRKLSQYGFVIPKISSDFSQCNNWWGDISNFELSKTLNSKCWLASWHKPLNDKTISSLKDIPAEFPLYYRSDQGFSGINNKVLRHIDDAKNLRYPGVATRYVKVVQCFGVTYNLEDDTYFIVENIVDSNGKFNGGRVIDMNSIKASFDLNSVISKIRTHLPSDTIKRIQFDNMVYEEGGSLVLCPLVEINYRQTIGTVVKSVTDILGAGTLYFATRDHLDNDSVILSPDDVRNICYFNRA